MIFDGSREQAIALLGAMAGVARSGGTGPLTELDRAALGSAATVVFGLEEPIDPDQLPSVSPAELADSLGGRGREALIPLVVMATVDGRIDPAAADLVRDHAAALGVEEPAVEDIEAVVHGELGQARPSPATSSR